MATASAALPPIAKMSMVCIWVETLLYGVNLVMYGLCMFILLRGANTTFLRRVLVALSTMLFLLCTIHVGASLRQLLEAFVYVPASEPRYSTLYWLDNAVRMSVLKKYLYDILVLAQYSVLIWRVYVVFMCNWKVVVFPITLIVALVGTLLTITTLSVAPGASPHSALISSLIEVAWVLDAVLNVSVTGAIVARLWLMGRQAASPHTIPPNQYAFAMYVIVESGSILLAVNISILGLYTSNNLVSFTILDVASQLAALVPFLIVVQVGLTSRYRSPRDPSGGGGGFSTTVLTTPDEMVFRAGIPEEREIEQDVPLRAYSKLSHSHGHASDVE